MFADLFAFPEMIQHSKRGTNPPQLQTRVHLFASEYAGQTIRLNGLMLPEPQPAAVAA